MRDSARSAPMTADELNAVLDAHGRWLRSEADGERANLAYANLAGADLTGAYLTRADLTDANLAGADLTGAYLTRADLTDADLTGADLTRAYTPDGIKWETYIEDVVPALLTAGGRTLDDVLATGCWDCHKWTSCPMAEAFGVHSLEDVPPLYRRLARDFVLYFDARLIPRPAIQGGDDV